LAIKAQQTNRQCNGHSGNYDFGPSWGANRSFPVLYGVDVVEFFVGNVSCGRKTLLLQQVMLIFHASPSAHTTCS
jgi:hypothetical protein